jgi:hypothetical protein
MLGNAMRRKRVTGNPSEADDACLAGATGVLTALRDAARGLVEASPTPVRRAADLHRALGVDAPLGWQLFRVATAVDPLATVAYIPRAGSMQKILRQAQKTGWDASAVAALSVAHEAFEAFVKKVAGTRGNFDAMVAALGNETSEQIQARHRSAAFRANAHVWGVRLRTYYRAWVAFPGSKPGMTHSASIHGWVDVQRLRADLVLGLRRGALQDSGGALTGQMSRMRVLEEFSSESCPAPEPLVGVENGCEVLRFDASEARIPLSFFGYDSLPDWYDPTPQLWYGVKILTTMPTEVLLIDMIVPRTWIDAATAHVSTHGNLADVQSAYADTDAFPIPATEHVQRLGTQLEALHTPDVPRCPELIRTVMDAIDCPDIEFEILRCRVRYPILHSLIWLMASSPD